MSGQVISEDVVGAVWDTCLAISGFDPAQARAECGITPHAVRHFLPDITMAAGWPLGARTLLARWQPIKERIDGPRLSQAHTRKAMANEYASGPAKASREFALRLRAFAIVETFVAGARWRDVIPKQRSGLPSFEFLVPELARFSISDDDLSCFDAGADMALAPVDDIEEFSDDGEQGSRVRAKRPEQAPRGSPVGPGAPRKKPKGA